MNTVNLTGRLTRDPELVETKAGTTIATLRIAIARRERNGAVFCDVKTFGKQATACAEHLTKGRQIAIAGRLELDEWTADSGQNRYRLYVIGERIEFIDRRADGIESTPGKDAVPAV